MCIMRPTKGDAKRNHPSRLHRAVGPHSFPFPFLFPFPRCCCQYIQSIPHQMPILLPRLDQKHGWPAPSNSLPIEPLWGSEDERTAADAPLQCVSGHMQPPTRTKHEDARHPPTPAWPMMVARQDKSDGLRALAQAQLSS